ncbi:MAG: hypothetical protein JNJ78_12645 [Anaerolineae bacterium]|nr:hypothetical protein [Anaerolineae bacterium]
MPFRSILSKGPRPLVFQLMIVAFILLLTIAPAFAQDEGLTVQAELPLGTISPYIYGANYGPWALAPVDMWPTVEASGVTMLRFPGGNWGDRNNLTKDQVDLFITQARMWKMEPLIHVRLEGGTPEQAAELVRYANIEKGYNIRYWSIGNEPTLFENYSIDKLNEEWRAIALAMEAVDPTILLVGPDVHQYPPTASSTDPQASMREWVRGFLEVNGDMVDIVSIHRYPFPVSFDSPPQSIDDMRLNTKEWDTIIPDLRAVVLEAAGRDIPVAVTEINSNWNNGASAPNTDYHAIWWADVLGRLIRQRVEMVHYFMLANFTDSNFGLMRRYDVRPAYYVFQIYKHFGSELLTSSSSDPDVTITAALRADGALTLIVINLSSEEKTLPFMITGFDTTSLAQVWLLNAEVKAEPVDDIDVSTESITLPKESVTLLVLSGT